MSTWDDGNESNQQVAGMGWLGNGPLGPVSLTPPKRNWQNVFYAQRTGTANPQTVNQIIAQREAAAAKAAAAAGTAGLGEDEGLGSRTRQYMQNASAIIARQRMRIRELEQRLARA